VNWTLGDPQTTEIQATYNALPWHHQIAWDVYSRAFERA